MDELANSATPPLQYQIYMFFLELNICLQIFFYIEDVFNVIICLRALTKIWSLWRHS
jgi:hypothetical protein